MSGVGAYTAPDPCTPRPSKLVASTATRDFSYLKMYFARVRAPRGRDARDPLIDIKSCSRRTVGAKRGAWWARMWHTCGTPIWVWHVATRVCRACEARGWFI